MIRKARGFGPAPPLATSLVPERHFVVFVSPPKDTETQLQGAQPT